MNFKILIQLNITLSLFTLVLSGCTSSNTAVIEHKENLIYRPDGVVKVVRLQSGDSLANIAANNNVSVQELATANNLYEGYTANHDRSIYIPLKKTKNDGSKYQVNNKETLSSYGNNYNSSSSTINEANSYAAVSADDNVIEIAPVAALANTQKSEEIPSPAENNYSKVNAASSISSSEKSNIVKEDTAAPTTLNAKALEINTANNENKKASLSNDLNSGLINKTRESESNPKIADKNLNNNLEEVQNLSAITKEKKNAQASEKIVPPNTEEVKNQDVKKEPDIKVSANQIPKSDEKLAADNDNFSEDLNMIKNQSQSATVSNEQNAGTEILEDNEEQSHTNSVNFKLSTPLNSDEFMWPLHGKVIKRFSKKKHNLNEGINIEAPLNSSILAAATGEVVYVGLSKQYGNLIIIKHSKGFFTAYAHTSLIKVKKGEEVSKGQVIAKVGQTGNVDSPQLYFSIRKDKATIDPESIVN